MKNLPEVAVSWEIFALFSLSCALAGAALGALAGGRGAKRPEGPAPETPGGPEKETPGGRSAQAAPAEKEQDTLEELAETLWLSDGPEAPPPLRDSGAEPSFLRPQTKAFWEEEIEPLRALFEKRGELPVIEKVLRELDRGGGCSSVVSGDGKSAFEPSAKRFSRVTLLDHSLRAARRMKEAHDSVYRERILWGRHLLAALAHDIGKMESLRSGEGRYVKDDHAAASARALGAWILETGGERAALELADVVAAVRNHHRSAAAPCPLLENLKKADAAAREEEFSGGRKKVRPAAGTGEEDAGEPPGWLVRDIPRILAESVGPAINAAELPEKPFVRALSATNGIVYVDPHWLFGLVREHMEREEIGDMRFFDSSDRGELRAKLLVTNSIKSRNWVSEEVRDGYYAGFWNYEHEGKKVRKGGFWIPVFAEAFGIPLAELERRKNGDVRRITSVEACVPRRRGK